MISSESSESKLSVMVNDAVLFAPQIFISSEGATSRVAAGLIVPLEYDEDQRICVHFADGDIGTKDAQP